MNTTELKANFKASTTFIEDSDIETSDIADVLSYIRAISYVPCSLDWRSRISDPEIGRIQNSR
jgi:hypothetical protein